ncbi:MAG: metallophosphoesterase [Bacteroidales bacterium]|nr:metallophosphoesterase [Bacteroidales bacterium]
MKRGLLCFAMALLLVPEFFGLKCMAQEMDDEAILSAIKEYPYRAAACHSPYYFSSEISYTPTPKGYTAFYISHFGRHGSRYQTRGSEVYDGVVALLDSLHAAKSLTAEGDSLRMELRHIQQAHVGMDGMLTRRGSAEHTGIARRLAARTPTVFRQHDRKIVGCTSTTVQRTIQSMAGFIAGLPSAGSGLDFHINCGFDTDNISRPTDKPLAREVLDSLIAAEEKVMSPSDDELNGLRSRLFVGYKASQDVLFKLFLASAPAGCLDIQVNPLRFFSSQELLSFYKKRDVSFNAKYGTFAPTRSGMANNGKKWLRLIVDDADRALDGNGHCADFRFAHDGNVGPTMNLLGIGGYAFPAFKDAPYRYWQSFRQICMASNLQLEFYKNVKSDVIVKALFNEEEVVFPGLEAIDKVYFKWDDVRRFFIGKCEDVHEVPDYYASYLEGKAAQIRQLQKTEIDGFYFITDMHFPVNCGFSASLLEALGHMAEKRLIVYGGDALTYVDDFDEGLAMQISALEQMRGVSPVLWARGNHDIVNYTGRKQWITKERKTLPAWESAKVLARFRPMRAVSNEVDPYTSYFYYDNPGKKVRYIVFDTTDTVQDDNMQGGLSDTQLRWVVEKAILGAPKGYGLVFVSHIPFLGEKKKIPAEDALSSFSEHSTFKLGEKTYDFASRQDLRMICVVCGHRHRDYSLRFPGGQAQINVTADCNYEDIKRAKGTVEEQSFDYVSISMDGRIRTVRIGKGEDRQF